jgi:phage N-6-adenine-methyltransferase
MNNELMFSSKSSDWETPQWLFDLLSKEFEFTGDACATKENAKHVRFYSPEQDALTLDWSKMGFNEGIGRIFMNPPYSRNNTYKWVKKAWEESQKGITVVCLLPARTDTKWFFEFCSKAYEIRFLSGRLKFGNSKDSAPFPSMIVIFKPNDVLRGSLGSGSIDMGPYYPYVSYWDPKKNVYYGCPLVLIRGREYV